MKSDLSELPTEVVEVCVNCKKSIMQRDRLFEGYLCLDPSYQVRRCANCGLRWLSPRPTRIGYESVYSAESYFTAEAGENISYENLVPVREVHFRQRLLSLKKFFPENQVLNILDYGAATGEFVAVAQSLGNVCIGVEFSSDARRIALDKNNISLVAPEDFIKGGVLFDVVHMNHVLEHMPDPAAHLVWCREQMTPEGILVLEVPQQFNNHIDRVKRFFGRGGKFNEFGAFSLHHTYFFNVRNLVEIVENCGFSVVHITTDVAGVRAAENASLRAQLIKIFCWVANVLGQGGDNIEIYARKVR